jgi:hypothetical protein
MAGSHQQQSLQRKLIYIAMILVIFFGLVFYRPFLVESRAEELKLRDQDVGDVELTGQVVKLALTGMRGFMVTSLWYNANEKQKKNQWNELEVIVRLVTKLQPHYVTPWLFQSWNLSYNVAVQCDREADQYFYITRGIELLAEGERQNRYNPDMRYFIGYYTQHKICQADRTNMLLALFELSCIDPNQRDPRRFGGIDPDNPGMVRDMVQFEKFCQEHPQLVRRLREKVRCDTPADVVQFLEENYRVPSLYEDVPGAVVSWEPKQSKKRRPAERFPILPPVSTGAEKRTDPLTEESTLGDEVDGFQVARAWYSYAQEALPPVDPDKPGVDGPITDPARQRLPHYTTILFRNYPPRSQTFAADRLESDGWFDSKGWLVTKWFPKDRFSDGRPAVVGGGRNWGIDYWTEAHGMWKKFGEKTGLYMSPENEKRVKEEAKKFAASVGIPESDTPREPTEQDNLTAEQLRLFKSFQRLHFYDRYRSLCNFPHFYYQSLVHSQEKTVRARKHFYQAEKYREAGKRGLALAEFEHPESLPAWAEIMRENPKFVNDDLRERTLELESMYLDVYRELHGRQMKQRLMLLAYLGQAAGPGLGDWPMLGQLARPHVLPDPDIVGLLDDVIGLDFVANLRIQKAGKGKPPLNMDPAKMKEMMEEMRQSRGRTRPEGMDFSPPPDRRGP